MRDPIPFTGNTLDRAANLRRDPDWLEKQLASPDSRFLPFWRLNVLTHESEQPGLVWLDSTVCDRLDNGAAPLLLGLRDGVAHFAVDVSSLADPVADLALDGARFSEVRRIATVLAVEDAGLLSHARALVDWHNRHRYCGVCGQPTSPREGGSMRKCDTCGADHFPRTDPVVIMVVWRGERCLLGRQKAWPQGNYSALAGFVDQGESIEEAVRREVLEEVGLEVDGVAYHASQPWPFPSSLMIGCFAHATGEEVTVDPFELDGARWFSRDEIRRAIAAPGPALGFSVPGRIAIAHHLIRDWSESGA